MSVFARLYKKPDCAHTLLKSDGVVTIDTEEKLVYTAPEILLDDSVTDKADVWYVRTFVTACIAELYQQIVSQNMVHLFLHYTRTSPYNTTIKAVCVLLTSSALM